MSEQESDTQSGANRAETELTQPPGGSGGKKLFTKDTAKEMGRKGGKARAVPDEPQTFQKIKDNLDNLYDELYKAAFGLGRFRDLPSEKRLGALKLLLERVEGRPTPKKEEQSGDNGGWSIGIRDE